MAELEANNKHSTKKNIGLAIKYFAPYKLSLLAVVIALTLTSVSVLALGKAIAFMIDQGFTSGSINLLNSSLLLLLVIILLLAIATFARAYLVNSIGERVVAALRQDVYNHILHISPRFFETHNTGDILSRLTTDTALLSSTIGSVVSVSLRNILMSVGGLVLLAVTSLKLTLCVAVIVPTVLAIIIIIGRQVRRLSRLAQEKIANISAHTEETINGIKTVQAFTRELFEKEEFAANINTALASSIKWIKARSVLAALVIITVFSSILAVLWVGGHDVIAGRMSAGALSSFIFYSIIVASSIGGLSEVIGDIQRAAGASGRLFDLLAVQSDIADPSEPQSLNKALVETIAFHNLTFSYPSRPQMKVIKNFSLTINKGEKVAIVGPSGSGKTTLFQLLLRFYDPESGDIALNGIDIRRLALQELRNQFALVAQEPVIFSASAYDNICYGNIRATEAEVKEAARRANILEFLESLPQGIHTFLGEKGVRISGGQKQRIAIARALIKDPQILLLDEATSNLDTHSEKQVQEALEELMQSRTTIVIAHRLSTIYNADRIVVLRDGMIDAIGKHQELVEQQGLYAYLSKSLEFSQTGDV